MTRQQCRAAVLQRIMHNRVTRGVKLPPHGLDMEAAVDRLLEKHYPARKPAYEGHVPPDYDFRVPDVLELERKMYRGEGR